MRTLSPFWRTTANQQLYFPMFIWEVHTVLWLLSPLLRMQCCLDSPRAGCPRPSRSVVRPCARRQKRMHLRAMLPLHSSAPKPRGASGFSRLSQRANLSALGGASFPVHPPSLGCCIRLEFWATISPTNIDSSGIPPRRLLRSDCWASLLSHSVVLAFTLIQRATIPRGSLTEPSLHPTSDAARKEFGGALLISLVADL